MASQYQIESMIIESLEEGENTNGEVFDMIMNVMAHITQFDTYMNNESETLGGPRDTLSTMMDWMDALSWFSNEVKLNHVDHDVWDEISGFRNTFELNEALKPYGLHFEPRWNK